MKKIGILFGKERSFPQAFVDRVNAIAPKGVQAELAEVDEVVQGMPTPYSVLIDRISQDVPFYRAYLKNAAISGTAVMNNPFWWSADEKFFNNSLALTLQVAVPKTVLLPSYERPEDTSAESFTNLKMMDWEKIVGYLGGFPLYMKPHSGGGWKSVYKVYDMDELFDAYHETGKLVMMLQQTIDFDHYFRCYYLSGDRVHIMPYEPRNPHHLRYIKDSVSMKDPIVKKIHDGVLRLNHGLGYDMNTVEFAVQDGVPYAIDFCNPAPDAEKTSVGEENFEWIVEAAANMAIQRAKAHKSGQNNLTWGNFIKSYANNSLLKES
jgi:hypothetical protein